MKVSRGFARRRRSARPASSRAREIPACARSRPCRRACNSAATSCTGRPPSMIWSDENSTCTGIGSCGMPDSSARTAGSTRTGSRVVLGDEAVGVELPRRQRRAQQRRRAEARIAGAGKPQRALLGTVAHLDLVEPRRGVIGLDLGAIRHGRTAGSAFAAGRASVTAPSKRGARCSNASTPSRSIASARWPGSMLRCTRVPLPSWVCPDETRNG